MKQSAARLETHTAAANAAEKDGGENDNAVDAQPEVSFDDAIARTRRLPIVAAKLVPSVPDGYQATDTQERIRRYRRLSTKLMPTAYAAARQIQAHRATWVIDMGDLAPDVRQIDVVMPEIEACEKTLQRLRALVAYHEERYDILRGDLYTFLQKSHDEYEHRVTRKPELADEYSRLAELVSGVREAIADGIAQAKADKKNGPDKG